MITRGMSLDEIIKEFEIDYNYIYEQHKRLNDDNRYRRYILKNLKTETTHVFKPIHYKTPRGNDYMLIPITEGYNQYKKYGLELHAYLYYRLDGSDYYVVSQTSYFSNLITDQEIGYGYTFYTPHYFDRYQERYLKNKKMPRLELITSYFSNSYEKGVIRCSEDEELLKKYPNNYYCYNPYGLSLGRFLTEDKKIILATTFLSFDMLRGNQIDEAKLLKEIYDEVN